MDWCFCLIIFEGIFRWSKIWNGVYSSMKHSVSTLGIVNRERNVFLFVLFVFPHKQNNYFLSISFPCQQNHFPLIPIKVCFLLCIISSFDGNGQKYVVKNSPGSATSQKLDVSRQTKTVQWIYQDYLSDSDSFYLTWCFKADSSVLLNVMHLNSWMEYVWEALLHIKST